MKTLLIGVLILILSTSFSDNPITPDCKCKGIPLHGRVRIVSARADFDVRIVSSNEDLFVDTTGYGNRGCGDWRIVSENWDFTVRFVSNSSDFKIRIATFRRGLPNR